MEESVRDTISQLPVNRVRKTKEMINLCGYVARTRGKKNMKNHLAAGADVAQESRVSDRVGWRERVFYALRPKCTDWRKKKIKKKKKPKK